MTAWPVQVGEAVETDEDEAYLRLVGKRVRVLRVFLGLSQEELATAAGVTRNYVSAVERAVHRLDVVRARRLALVLRVRIGDLLADLRPAGDQ